MTGRLRITSLNLRGFVDLDDRLPRIARFVAETAPDVLLLQEVVYLPELAPVSNARLLQRLVEMPVRHEAVTRLQSGRDHPVYREGLAILSTLPVESTDAIALRHEPRDPHHRIVQLADVRAADGVWPLGNVHLSIRDDFALEHLREVLTMTRDAGEPRILGGDFNVNRLERWSRIWGDDVLSSTVQQGVSRPASHENDDYFLVPPAFRIQDVRLSDDGLSDHRAVTIDLVRAATPEASSGGA